MPTRRTLLKRGTAAAGMSLVVGCLSNTGGGSSNGSSGGKNNSGSSDIDYPTKPVTLLNPYPPGGGTDAYFSQIVGPLSDELGVNVKQRYVSGAAGANGTRELARTKDPHTIGNVNLPAFLMLQWQLENPGFKVQNLTPLTSFATAATMVIARPGKFKSINEVINKYQNGDLSALAGESKGGRIHLTAWLMKQRWGLDYSEYVGFDGGGETISAILGGDVPVGVIGVTPTVTYISQNKLDGVVVGSQKPREAIPNVPTTEKAGLKPIDDIAVYSRNFFGIPSMGNQKQQFMANAMTNVLESKQIQEWTKETGNPIISDGINALKKRVKSGTKLKDEWKNFYKSYQ